MATSKKKRVKNDVRRDTPDLRDRIYEPALVALKPEIPAPKNLHILDQGEDGACTGFGLAAAIHRLYQMAECEIVPSDEKEKIAAKDRAKQLGLKVDGRPPREEISPFMLYDLARRHDEWRGHTYEGSSTRGALRGWFHNGVCRKALWQSAWEKGPFLTIDQAQDARNCTLGAYYRLRPVISDFHAALNEVPVIYVSADVHEGWDDVTAADPVIAFPKKKDGGHAFAIVGYNDKGFWIQNSWGRKWGDDGVALWTYEDWNENLMDAWVIQLARATPTIFHRRNTAADKGVGASRATREAPTRAEILGHFLNVDDGKFVDNGRYWTAKNSIQDTADLFAEKGYKHLAVYAHGGLNSQDAAARRIVATKGGFQRNGVYPFYVMYNTGLLEEVGDIVQRKFLNATERVGAVTDYTDRLIEAAARKPVTPIWDEMKRGAELAFDPEQAGSETIMMFANKIAATGGKQKIHLVGHSTGAILLGHLLEALDRIFKNTPVTIDTCSLLAPACTIEFFNEKYGKRSGAGATKPTKIGRLNLYNLTDRQERDDNVAGAYRKSLLYLVSNAFEKADKKPLLGMEIFLAPKPSGIDEIILSEGKWTPKDPKKEWTPKDDPKCAATSHGGFDNDPCTLNHLLVTMLDGEAPKEPFTSSELDY